MNVDGEKTALGPQGGQGLSPPTIVKLSPLHVWPELYFRPKIDFMRKFLAALFPVLLFGLWISPTRAAVWDCEGATTTWYWQVDDNTEGITEQGLCGEDECALSTNWANFYSCPYSGGGDPACWDFQATAALTAADIMDTICPGGDCDGMTSGEALVECERTGARIDCETTTPHATASGAGAFSTPTGSYGGTVFSYGEGSAPSAVNGITCLLHEDTEGETVYVYATNTVEVAATNTEAVLLATQTFIHGWAVVLGVAVLGFILAWKLWK